MVTKKELSKRIDGLESKLEELQAENNKLIKVVADINEKVLYLWKEDSYKEQEANQSIFDEWINGAKVGEVNEV